MEKSESCNSGQSVTCNFNEEKIRFSTFVEFPKDCDESPILLAENGFYNNKKKVGENLGEVKCNFCGLIIKVKPQSGILNIHSQKLNCPMVTKSACQNKPWIETKEAKEFFLKELTEKSCKTLTAIQLVNRCAERDTCHYHDIGRLCTETSCAGITDDLTFPKYRTYHERLKTLDLSSSDYENLKHMIADAGYFYQGGHLWCFFCADKKRMFNASDVVMAEHAKTSPQCGYVRCEMGDDFIHIIQELLKCDSINFEILKTYLPQYEPWFTEQSVKKRQKSTSDDDSVNSFLDKMRASSSNYQEIPTCTICLKERSAVRGVSCCGIRICVDCSNRKRKCLCENVIDHSSQRLI